MSDYVSFDAVVEPMHWGKATYTIIRLAPDIMTALGDTKRVEGELAEHPVNLAITRAPVIEDAFLWAGKSLLDRIGAQPGEVLQARLRPVSSDLVETPTDVMNALRSGECLEAWEALTPGKKRGFLHTIESAKRVETRAKRIAALLVSLR